MTARSVSTSAILVLAGLAVTSASAGAQATTATTKAPCVAKPITLGGSPGMQFCGPARATVKVGGKTYSFSEGFCAHDLAHHLALQLSLGTDVPFLGAGQPNRGRPLFELTLSTTGQKGSLLAVDFAGHKLLPGDTSITATYRPIAALTGTFHGQNVSGTWNCHGGIYKLNQR